LSLEKTYNETNWYDEFSANNFWEEIRRCDHYDLDCEFFLLCTTQKRDHYLSLIFKLIQIYTHITLILYYFLY
jgi:hypothetical protein